MKSYTIQQAIEYTKKLGDKLNKTNALCLLREGREHITTHVIVKDDQLVCAYFPDRVVEKLKPGQMILELDDAIQLIDKSLEEKYDNFWIEISDEEYWDMLEALPPEKYEAGCFRMMEYTEGQYTAHFIQRGDKYYTATRKAVDDWEVYKKELAEERKFLDSLTPMSDDDHKTIMEIHDKGELIYTNEDMHRSAYGKPFSDHSDQSILDDVATINEIMHRYDSKFVRFKSFTEDKRMRYEYLWDKGFVGAGYTKLSLLKHGMPLGNYITSFVQKLERYFNEQL